ncbi:zinc finger CCHC domain-containing protein [Skeletonema marinoi]|uniref:Zinc finger CCHC domain-containing protein n=1 Tax=Skeletonema marinoi TaxID=267567 RepID=A0AAD8YCF5_9STRA|nr:zinc finger CCHC domain-containing protein [Skeletonema marinoi]
MLAAAASPTPPGSGMRSSNTPTNNSLATPNSSSNSNAHNDPSSRHEFKRKRRHPRSQYGSKNKQRGYFGNSSDEEGEVIEQQQLLLKSQQHHHHGPQSSFNLGGPNNSLPSHLNSNNGSASSGQFNSSKTSNNSNKPSLQTTIKNESTVHHHRGIKFTPPPHLVKTQPQPNQRVDNKEGGRNVPLQQPRQQQKEGGAVQENKKVGGEPPLKKRFKSYVPSVDVPPSTKTTAANSGGAVKQLNATANNNLGASTIPVGKEVQPPQQKCASSVSNSSLTTSYTPTSNNHGEEKNHAKDRLKTGENQGGTQKIVLKASPSLSSSSVHDATVNNKASFKNETNSGGTNTNVGSGGNIGGGNNIGSGGMGPPPDRKRERGGGYTTNYHPQQQQRREEQPQQWREKPQQRYQGAGGNNNNGNQSSQQKKWTSGGESDGAPPAQVASKEYPPPPPQRHQNSNSTNNGHHGSMSDNRNYEGDVRVNGGGIVNGMYNSRVNDNYGGGGGDHFNRRYNNNNGGGAFDGGMQRSNNKMEAPPRQHQVPPEGYVCRLCNIPGHWIQACPTKDNDDHHQRQMNDNNNNNPGFNRGMHRNNSMEAPPPSHHHHHQQQSHNPIPPEGYVCRLCNIPGHWIQACPTKDIMDHQRYQNTTAKDVDYYQRHSNMGNNNSNNGSSHFNGDMHRNNMEGGPRDREQHQMPSNYNNGGSGGPLMVEECNEATIVIQWHLLDHIKSAGRLRCRLCNIPGHWIKLVRQTVTSAVDSIMVCIGITTRRHIIINHQKATYAVSAMCPVIGFKFVHRKRWINAILYFEYGQWCRGDYSRLADTVSSSGPPPPLVGWNDGFLLIVRNVSAASFSRAAAAL